MIRTERIRADIEALREFTATPGAGVTRLSFFPQERQARRYLLTEMERAGLAMREHPSGCLLGRLAGKNPGRPAVLTGSHYDTVHSGGAFDGVCGLVAALEMARSMREDGYFPSNPVEIVGFLEEEGTRFGSGLLCSAALLGLIPAEELAALRDDNGVTFAAAAAACGLSLADLPAEVLRPDDLKAFVELHIEQGPVLEQYRREIGVVDCIAAMCFGQVTVCGRADHAGTTPTELRLDAMRGAVEVISRFYEAAGQLGSGVVATVGKLVVHPGSANVVPDRVVFSVDYRCRDGGLVKRMRELLLEALEALKARGLSYQYEDGGVLPAVQMDARIMASIEEEAARLGYSSMRLPSGAGHDTMNLAEACPVGMIFLPSAGGRSHCPEENTGWEEIAKGARVLEAVVKRLCES